MKHYCVKKNSYSKRRNCWWKRLYKSRPIIKLNGNVSENSQIETGATEPRSKPVETDKSGNFSDKPDILLGQKSDINKSLKLDKSLKKRPKLDQKSNKSVTKTDIHNKSPSQGKQTNVETEQRRSERIKQQKPFSYIEINIDNYIMCGKSITCKIPNSFQDVENCENKEKWHQAINDEINSLIINNIWSLVSKPEDKNIVDCKWIFTIKNDEFGNPEKYKARLVARGFSQEYLIDYAETFAPVARISSFRFIIALANQYNLLIHHMDVKTAFWNGTLKEEIYTKVPEGVKSNKNQVCKLNKSIYG